MGICSTRVLNNTAASFFPCCAADHGQSFRDLSSVQRERLLRVLAYVRKDDDRIPDYQAGGFLDDQGEVNATRFGLAPVLKSFKDWRLRHEVPVLWSFSLGTALASA
jgi:hypothetical protein